METPREMTIEEELELDGWQLVRSWEWSDDDAEDGDDVDD